MLRSEMEKARRSSTVGSTTSRKEEICSSEDQNEIGAKPKKFRTTQEVELPNDKENWLLPRAHSLGRQSFDDNSDDSNETEDIDFIPHDLLMSAITVEIISKIKAPSTHNLRIGRCELCGLHNIHGNSRSQVCRLCKLCVPCPEAIISKMKLKREHEEIKKAAGMTIAQKIIEPVQEQQLIKSHSQSSDGCPADVISLDVAPCPHPRQTEPPISDKKNVQRKVSQPFKVKCQSSLFRYF